MNVSMSWEEHLAGCCRIDGKLTRLPMSEARTLAAMIMTFPGEVTTISDLIDRVWPEPDTSPEYAARIVTCYVRRLRARGIPIETWHGVGYRLERQRLAA